ncbi:MAG: type III-A CRISPR-associated RAMP protein Csm3, partial [Clostridia bacterium]|nr:type III-A CRISPR-associated RAMP protein Csm3 [Clostridia bacterium]
MYGKIIIKCKLRVLTGLHIGGSNVFSPIGAVDSPVIRDPLTNKPIVPGSSLKGKMRTLLVRSFKVAKSYHETNLPEFVKDPDEVKRLFGGIKLLESKTASESTKTSIIRSRLQFAD